MTQGTSRLEADSHAQKWRWKSASARGATLREAMERPAGAGATVMVVTVSSKTKGPVGASAAHEGLDRRERDAVEVLREVHGVRSA